MYATDGKTPVERNYPMLKIHKENGFVVLFTSPSRGCLVLHDGKIYTKGDLGTYSSKWVSSMFEPYNGQVHITN